jgi:hypothetical protein
VVIFVGKGLLPLTESTKAALRAAIFIFIIKYQHGIFALMIGRSVYYDDRLIGSLG